MSEKKTKLETGSDEILKFGIGIRFKKGGKIYTFETNGIDANPGMWVVAESEMGLGLGLIVKPKQRIEKTEQPLKKVLRVASEKDFESDRNNRHFENEAKAFCIETTKSRNLPMKIVATEATLDRKRLIFYFTADGRVDFRELVRDLAAKFKTRIEMRQIGVRDEVKLIGGIGVCGRQTCCASFLTSFEPISIRMAKKQELLISQSKLSGICGRLMCCLNYELEDSDKEKITVQKRAATTIEAPPETAECSCKKGICSRSVGAKPRRKKGKRGQSEKTSHAKPPSEPQDKGKPFSKRRSFWKKKKH